MSVMTNNGLMSGDLPCFSECESTYMSDLLEKLARLEQHFRALEEQLGDLRLWDSRSISR